jgi:hypothetical protein
MADKERPIDAELLTTNIAQIAKNCARSDAQKALIGRILYMIENMPTIETEPVKHGWWIYGENDDGQDGIFCSECEHFVPWFYEYYDKSDDLINDNPRCPNCGAIMTFGGGEEEQRAHAEYMERAAKERASEDGDSE